MDISFGKRKIAACIKIILFLIYLNLNYSFAQNLKNNYIFILLSSSLTKASLQQYLLDADKWEAEVVMQGFVNNSLKDTARLISSENTGISIDPIIFNKLNIQKIPAIIKFDQTGLDCLNQKNCIPEPNNYDIVYGNISLDYATKLFARSHV